MIEQQNIQTLPKEDEQVRTNGQMNKAALRRHALKVSQLTRGGKFSRVSEQFLNLVEADFEALCRKFRNPNSVGAFAPVAPDEADDFLTGEGKRKLCEAVNIYLARLIQVRVNDTRVGKTL